MRSGLADLRAAAPVSAFVPLRFALGEAYQFDWSHEVVLIGGATVTVKVAHVRLCHSRMRFVRARVGCHHADGSIPASGAIRAASSAAPAGAVQS